MIVCELTLFELVLTIGDWDTESSNVNVPTLSNHLSTHRAALGYFQVRLPLVTT